MCSFINFGEFYLDQWMVEWMVVLPALNVQIFTTRLSVSKSISAHDRPIWCLLCGVVFLLVVCADHGISSHGAVILEIINEPVQIEMIIQLETISSSLRKSSKPRPERTCEAGWSERIVRRQVEARRTNAQNAPEPGHCFLVSSICCCVTCL